MARSWAMDRSRVRVLTLVSLTLIASFVVISNVSIRTKSQGNLHSALCPRISVGGSRVAPACRSLNTFRMLPHLHQSRAKGMYFSPESIFSKSKNPDVSCKAGEVAGMPPDGLPDDVSDEADIEVRLFILLQQLKIRHKVATNKGQTEIATEMDRSIKELEGLINERDQRWAPEAMDELRDELDTTLRTNGPETLRRNLFRKIEAIINPVDKVKFKLGTKVIHKEKRYTGVIAGYHPGCRETDEWVESNGILQMLGATARPFYMVLVDVRDVESPVVTYVPEHMLETVRLKDVRKFLPKELQEEKKKPPEVVHPFVYSLFYGQNQNGDYLPTEELLSRYGEYRGLK